MCREAEPALACLLVTVHDPLRNCRQTIDGMPSTVHVLALWCSNLTRVI
jgi:hypothetical protein